MIVTIDQALFADPATAQLDLMALLHLCRERHVLLCHPMYEVNTSDQQVNRWLSRLPGKLAREARAALERGIDAKAGQRAGTCRVRISTNPISLNSPVPNLDIPTALRLLRMPLRLFVENCRNDAEFVRTVAAPKERQQLETALSAGWIEFEHGGGLQEMYKRVQTAHKPGPQGQPPDPQCLWLIRLWVLFDHDGTAVDAPSSQSQRMGELCDSIQDPWPLLWRRHERRAIENYLPKDALKEWAKGRDDRQALVNAFAGLDDDQRHHYHMKKGLRGDASREWKEQHNRDDAATPGITDLPPLFKPLTEDIRTALRAGFGGQIAELFHTRKGKTMKEEWLRDELSWETRRALIQSIFERM